MNIFNQSKENRTKPEADNRARIERIANLKIGDEIGGMFTDILTSVGGFVTAPYRVVDIRDSQWGDRIILKSKYYEHILFFAFRAAGVASLRAHYYTGSG